MTKEQKDLRKKLEDYVYAHNIFMKDLLLTMNNVVLLRNSHPVYRPDFARELERANMITKHEAEEFVKIIKIPS